jgi:D-cysteine desulfhydrase
VFTAVSSAGSAAGLALGLALAGLSTEVVAVRVYPPPLTSEAWIRRLASRAHERLTALAGTPLPPFDPARIRVVADQMGPGYAQPTPAAERAAEAGRDLGVPLDGTYTAKAFAGFLAAAASPRYREARLVFMATYDPRLPEGLGDDAVTDRVPAKLRAFL